MASTGVPAQDKETRALRRVSSLVLNSPGRRSGAEEDHGLKLKEIGQSSVETVPDSEEERIRGTTLLAPTVIEISSDEEAKENVEEFRVPLLGKKYSTSPADVLPSKGSPEIKPPVKSPTKSDRFTTDLRNFAKNPPKIQMIRSRQVVQSSSSESSDSDDSDVQGLGNNSHERPILTLRIPGLNAKPGVEQRKPDPAPSSTDLPFYIDDDDEPQNDDGAILILNEPQSARKPIRLPKSFDSHVIQSKGPVGNNTPQRERRLDSDSSASESDDDVTTTPAITPSKQKIPRQTKAARVLAEQKRREAYAQNLFLELNRDVFANGLPNETQLIWNKRLLTTAGRAKWHRNRDGVETTAIELAVKILDCDERIRNTLSHEMCHLASWYIDGKSTEGHGNVWKRWAAKVMRKRPDIAISTKHNYEITHPYEWKCENCAKIYGRFSKSIRPDECVCGACKVGKLTPLFTVRNKGTPKTKADSRMAAGKPQDSPHSVNRPDPPPDDVAGGAKTTTHLSTDLVVYHIDDSDDEVEILATVLGNRLTVAEVE